MAFRSGGVKGAASSGPLSLKEKTKGRGEHGWWTETTNEQVGWGGPTSARPRPETELVRMWEDSLRCHGSPTTRKRRTVEKRGGPSLGAGGGETLTTSLQTKRQKERKRERHPKIGETKGKNATSGSGSRSRDIFSPLAAARGAKKNKISPGGARARARARPRVSRLARGRAGCVRTRARGPVARRAAINKD